MYILYIIFQLINIPIIFHIYGIYGIKPTAGHPSGFNCQERGDVTARHNLEVKEPSLLDCLHRNALLRVKKSYMDQIPFVLT